MVLAAALAARAEAWGWSKAHSLPISYELFCRGDEAEETGDYVLAGECFEEGARLGDETCWLRLGFLFDGGLGVPKDKDTAMRCWRAAWRLGLVAAAHNIAILYRQRGDRRAAFGWFQRAASVGDIDSVLELAKAYLGGLGVRRSAQSAAQCLRIALAAPGIQPWEAEEARDLLVESGRVG